MLKTRIITALVILPIVLFALFALPSTGWLLFSLAIMAAAAWEWTRLAGFTALQARIFLVVCAVLAVGMAAFYIGPRFGVNWFENPIQRIGILRVLLGISAAFWVIVVPLWLLNQWRVRSAWSNALAGVIVLFPTWLALLLLRDAGPWFILSFAAIVWVADIAAYFSGKKFGKHKLAPAISPGKTVEGVVGGVLGVIAYYFLWQWLTQTFNLGGAVRDLREQGNSVLVLFVLLALISVVGDLFESWMKRGVSMKDSSNLLPGHGGVLDRIDALTSSLPVACFYLLMNIPV